MTFTTLANARTTVHPRIRGADDYMSGIDDPAYGSPPHTRGRCRCGFVRGRFHHRFTPAYAGQMYLQIYAREITTGSPPHTRGRWLHWDQGLSRRTVHPRIRGADARRTEFLPCCFSVHPRIRGADEYRRYRTHQTSTVHPRIRGADVSHHNLVNRIVSVHPRIRGADDCGEHVAALRGRFTPAYAGQIPCGA